MVWRGASLKKEAQLRSFDPLKDEHPVTWLLSNAKPELFAPLHDWLCHVLGSTLPHPSDLRTPDKWATKLFVFHELQILPVCCLFIDGDKTHPWSGRICYIQHGYSHSGISTDHASGWLDNAGGLAEHS